MSTTATRPSSDVLIIGAGLGGLTAALALARFGISVRVFEQARQLGEVGAGITISSGAMRCFELLGIEAQVIDVSAESVNLPFLHYQTGAVLRRGLGNAARPATARSARQLHRADLHALLVTALCARAPYALSLGQKLVAIEQDHTGVTAQFESGQRARGDVLIGCDGVRSVVRRIVIGDGAPRFAGQVAYRCLVPRELAAPHLDSSTGAVYIGPGATFNRYPLRRGELINCVGIARTDAWREEGWNTPATPAEVLAQFADWHPPLRRLIAAAPAQGIIKWGLFEREPLPRWTLGGAALLGDAAHPMLPFLGLGAAMAIEDGTVLARAVAASADPRVGLQRYELARRPRTTRVFEASRQQGRLSQATDPERYGTAPAPAHDPSYFDYDPASVEV
jgi:salicylate hydroxylase